MIFGATGGAHAQDLFEFLNQAFSGGAQHAEPLPQPAYAPPDAPPLTVRAKPRQHRLHVSRDPSNGGNGRGGRGRYDVADLKGVTMYTDRTLSRGDAVMTPSGIRVFNGSASWPYTDDDFVALSSGRLTTTLRKELTAMDNASRPALRPND